MESHSGLVKLKEIQIEGHRRKVSQIRTMIAEFDRLVAELDREIGTEENRTGNHDPKYFAYSTYAKAAAGVRQSQTVDRRSQAPNRGCRKVLDEACGIEGSGRRA